MRNIILSGLGLAALVATGTVVAADVTTDADSLSVSAQGELIEGVLLSDRLTDATNDAATGSDDDDDDHDEHAGHDHADTGDTGDDEKGCGCSSSGSATGGALLALLPLGLVGLRRRQD